MSFVLNILSDVCDLFIQPFSIANDESITYPITQFREEFCLQDESNPSENFEQAREVESIEKVLTDNQTCFSSESLYVKNQISI
jgi:hypothetical protein